MILAADFAATTSGYITGIGLPVALAGVGYIVKSLKDVLKDHGVALSQLQQTAAVQLSEFRQVQIQVTANSSDIVTLKESTAVLKAVLSSHETWASSEKERVHDRIDQAQKGNT